jgi:hypothetical protein
MKAQLAVAAAGGALALSLAGCALPVQKSEQTPAPTVTVTQAPAPAPAPAIDQDEQDTIDQAWHVQPLSGQRAMCGAFRTSATAALTSLNDGLITPISRTGFIVFFTAHCDEIGE